MRKTPKKIVVDVQFIDPQTQTKIKRRLVYVGEGCRYYFNAQHKLMQLTRGERAFYDFLCERMDDSNRVTIDNSLRVAFGDFINRVTSTKTDFQPSSASKYISKLSSVGLLLNTTRNTLYIVNPKHAFRGTESRRQHVVKDLIEHRIEQGLPVDTLIDVPLQTFMSGSTSAR